MEPTDVHEFSKQMTEASESHDLTPIALAISILAVLVALVTVQGHRTHTEAVLGQSRADDLWNEYQAKKIRQDNLMVVVDTLSLQTAPTAATTAKVNEYKAHIAKWQGELSEGQAKAREFEAEVAHAETQAGRYDLSEALLQIGVVLASITLLTHRRAYFLFGLGLGVMGVAAAIAGLLA